MDHNITKGTDNPPIKLGTRYYQVFRESLDGLTKFWRFLITASCFSVYDVNA